MSLTQEEKQEIKEVIIKSIRSKLKKYRPETKYMPFHFKLLGKDRMALFSFIHSLNTTFGISIFEPVAEQLSQKKFIEVKRQYALGNQISGEAQQEVQNIINELSTGQSSPCKRQEIKRIRKVLSIENLKKIKTVKADLFLKNEQGEIFLVDIKTAKPNISNFKDFKRTLLEWIALYLQQEPKARIHSFIAIPYNPYHPKPYERWTMKGMLDIKEELKVAEEFCDFLGGEGAYEELLNCFEKAGKELRPELDKYFKKFEK